LRCGSKRGDAAEFKNRKIPKKALPAGSLLYRPAEISIEFAFLKFLIAVAREGKIIVDRKIAAFLERSEQRPHLADPLHRVPAGLDKNRREGDNRKLLFAAAGGDKAGGRQASVIGQIIEKGGLCFGERRTLSARLRSRAVLSAAVMLAMVATPAAAGMLVMLPI